MVSRVTDIHSTGSQRFGEPLPDSGIDPSTLTGDPASRPLRVVLYSHDTMGLGHIRRNLTIAHALRNRFERLQVLLVSGAKEAGSFALPVGADCLVMPSLYKETDGCYRARRLPLELESLVHMRSQVLQSAVASFNPHVMIVDAVPRGACGELDSTLAYLRRQGDTRCVLGLRDILDDPEKIRLEWQERDCISFIEENFDQVWIYGDRRVYDHAVEYDYPETLANKLRYTGYLDRNLSVASPAVHQRPEVPDSGYALCMVGGGQDGEQLACAFADAPLPDGISGVLIAGPHMAPRVRKRLHQGAAARGDLVVHDFVEEPIHLVSNAACIVSMGGYNSLSESLSHRKPTLVVPRVQPRREQLIRARRLRRLELVDMVHPTELSAHYLGHWISRNAIGEWDARKNQLDLGAAQRLPRLFGDLVGGSTRLFSAAV